MKLSFRGDFFGLKFQEGETDHYYSIQVDSSDPQYSKLPLINARLQCSPSVCQTLQLGPICYHYYQDSNDVT